MEKFTTKSKLGLPPKSQPKQKVRPRIFKKIHKISSKNLTNLGYFGRTLIPTKDKKAFFYKSQGNEIWKIDLNRDMPYYPKKVAEFSNEFGPHDIIDYSIDFETEICYAVTLKGDIIACSLYSWVPKESKKPGEDEEQEKSKKKDKDSKFVEWVHIKQTKRKTALGMFKKDKYEKYFTACTLSRRGKYLVASASKRVNKKIIKHYIYVYTLSRGEEKPEIYARTEFATKWEGSKPKFDFPNFANFR